MSMERHAINLDEFIDAGEQPRTKPPAEVWEAPVPLRAFVPPSFPTSCLPADLRAYVEALCSATQTPPDLAALVCLSVVAAACAKRVELEIRPGWREPLNVYTVTVLPSGNLKSAVVADASGPLTAYEQEEAVRLGQEIKKAAARRKVAEKALERAQSEAAKAGDHDERAARLADVTRAVDELAGLPELVAPRLVVDDVTQEKLAVLMAEQGERMAVLSPEAGLFGLMGGRYGSNGGPNLDVFLKAHAGDRLTVDRIGREPVLLENPALTLGLAIQPDVIRSLADEPAFRGRGLLARFLWAVPRSRVGARDLDAPHVPADVRRRYEHVVRGLLAMQPAQTQDGRRGPHTLNLSTAAAEELRAFRGWLEPLIGEGGELGVMADWGSKLPGAVARVAGLLHLAARANEAQPWAGSISAETMAAAVTIGRHLIPHAQAAFGLMGADPAIEHAERVFEWLRRDGVQRFTIREAMRARPSLRTADDATEAVTILSERGYVRAEDRVPTNGRTGRPRASTWAVSPFVSSVRCHVEANLEKEKDTKQRTLEGKLPAFVSTVPPTHDSVTKLTKLPADDCEVVV